MDQSQAHSAPTAIADETTLLAADRLTVAPDGSDVRVLLRIPERGSMAHFELGPKETSVPVRHRTVSEIWYVLRGRGLMWRRLPVGDEGEVELRTGTCVTIPVGTDFQFRSLGNEALEVIAVTMPPWPLEDAATEAIAATGPWTPTLGPGPGLATE
jgi:mannose-6-phosphate isomerase-like protein (cupin superfamily)